MVWVMGNIKGGQDLHTGAPATATMLIEAGMELLEHGGGGARAG
jgi:hypothetical protein